MNEAKEKFILELLARATDRYNEHMKSQEGEFGDDTKVKFTNPLLKKTILDFMVEELYPHINYDN